MTRPKGVSHKKKKIDADEDEGKNEGKKSKKKSKKKGKNKEDSDSDSDVVEVTRELAEEFEAHLKAKRETAKTRTHPKKEKKTPPYKAATQALLQELEQFTTPTFNYDPFYTTDPPPAIASRGFHEQHVENLEYEYGLMGNMSKQATMFIVLCNVSETNYLSNTFI